MYVNINDEDDFKRDLKFCLLKVIRLRIPGRWWVLWHNQLPEIRRKIASVAGEKTNSEPWTAPQESMLKMQVKQLAQCLATE